MQQKFFEVDLFLSFIYFVFQFLFFKSFMLTYQILMKIANQVLVAKRNSSIRKQHQQVLTPVYFFLLQSKKTKFNSNLKQLQKIIKQQKISAQSRATLPMLRQNYLFPQASIFKYLSIFNQCHQKLSISISNQNKFFFFIQIKTVCLDEAFHFCYQFKLIFFYFIQQLQNKKFYIYNFQTVQQFIQYYRITRKFHFYKANI
eukprot:TRINITY_DN3580_c0_g2_i2.p1 TRINITY_DN3580_c0_g2~~TRINITY_DN3580_c0_g2_i2.p1  ORF type:complete len:201 (+),score=-19.11 TRINITY_DN3580_c0_g2_i2:109-711(+)